MRLKIVWAFTTLVLPGLAVSLALAGSLAGGVEAYSSQATRPEGLSFIAAAALSRLAALPEPATMILLGSGLLGLVGYAKKKKIG